MPQKKKQQKDIVTLLADAGDDALQKLQDLPGAARFTEAAHALREQLEEVYRRVRSLDPLERRVAALERRLDELSASAPASTKTRRAKSTARKPAAKKPAR